LYVGVYNTDYVEFYQSVDGGVNWTAKGSINQSPFMKNSFIVSQKFPNTLYYGGVECYRSTNGGNNWTRINEWWEFYDDIEICFMPTFLALTHILMQRTMSLFTLIPMEEHTFRTISCRL
jgi:hypothetical protein